MCEATLTAATGFQRRCIVCGEMFPAKRPWAKYCSDRCRLKGWKINRIDKVLQEVRRKLIEAL